MTDPAPAPVTGPPSELDKLRRRVEALSRKRDEAETRLRALLVSLLPLDDVLADTRRRAGALHEARTARETASAAIALSEQVDAAHRMLRGAFARHDVSPMDVMGRVVDPTEMRIVGTEAHPTRPDGTVLKEKVTGFRLGSAILRQAEVVIAVTGAAPEPVAPADVTEESDGPGTVPDGRSRSQPRRTTRSQRRLPLKPSARPGRRSRRI
ncbi:nucleotide exchange factor GrpE [Streptomyces sp. NPDC058733]|uniref:nucleotide exchange factor GrpE n=1 Tax=Streptomyces sp. NPDC058733 TaxID=3346614 RepID=UPI0036C2ADC2